MADGTLRISFDIEPANAQDAFRLFAAPGTPAAIAALQVGYAAASDTPAEDAPKGGALAKLAGMWCADKTFHSWLGIYDVAAGDPEGRAALRLYEECEIQSRRQLDHDPAAAERFHRLIRGPYSRHLIARGIVA